MGMELRPEPAAPAAAPLLPNQAVGARPVIARPARALPTKAKPIEGWRRDLSTDLRRLAEIALSQALDIIVREGGPMPPLVVLDRPSGPVLGRFDGEPRAALSRARAYVTACDADRAAVAWDGYLTVGGIRQDAVVVAASDRGRTGVVVAHRHRETVEGTVVVGRPVLIGPTDPLL